MPPGPSSIYATVDSTAMQGKQRIIRVPRVDDPDGSSFCLLSITPNGHRHPLDVKVIGTEGEAAFVCTRKPATWRLFGVGQLTKL
jgi:hypothetical protein